MFPRRAFSWASAGMAPTPLSTRHVEARMLERGGHVEHSTIHRWGGKDRPSLEEALHPRKRPGWTSGRMDEPDLKEGPGDSRSRAVDQHGQTRDLLRTEPRAPEAALRLPQKASRRHGLADPDTLGEVVKAGGAVERLTQDQEGGPGRDLLQRPGDRAAIGPPAAARLELSGHSQGVFHRSHHS